MTVSELITKLSQCPNLNSQVKVRPDYEPGPSHYTVDLVVGDDPVVVYTHRVDWADSDDASRRPMWVDLPEI